MSAVVDAAVDFDQAKRAVELGGYTLTGGTSGGREVSAENPEAQAFVRFWKGTLFLGTVAVFYKGSALVTDNNHQMKTVPTSIVKAVIRALEIDRSEHSELLKPLYEASVKFKRDDDAGDIED